LRIIDLKTWERRQQYELFRSYAFPHFSLTVKLDITGFVQMTKSKNISMFSTVLFAIMRAANDIPEFRTRFIHDRIFEYDVVHPSYTVPIANNHFAFCETEYSDDWNIFDENCRQATKKAKEQAELIENTAEIQHWIYTSCAPWLDFTSGTHPASSADDCIPRISWGKVTENADRWFMPVNMQVHHALMDGYHAGKFFELLEKELRDFGANHVTS